MVPLSKFEIDRSIGVISSIKKLYQLSFENNNAEAFQHWKEYYVLIHGKFDTQKKVDYDKFELIYGIKLSEDSLFNLLFAIETYYATLMRLTAARMISSIGVNNFDDILNGSFFSAHGIYNYTCDPIYDWYTQYPDLKQVIFEETNVLSGHINDSSEYQDLLKDIYEDIFPSKIRNGMGEFHTPSWIIDFILDEIEKDDPEFSNKVTIDPTCGSGSFLINILQRSNGSTSCVGRLIGIDLNPISVLTAKTNIILSMREFDVPVVLQIYQGDVIEDPISRQKNDILQFGSNSITVLGTHIDVDKNWTYQEIITAYKNSKKGMSNSYLEQLFVRNDISDYAKDCILSTLARFTIRNCDYVVGNPPWINWEYLPEDYKLNNISVWKRYQLFSMKGMNKTFIKEDISELITYVSVDKFLKEGGRLAFVLKESLFKSSKQAQEFRQFKLQNTKTDLCVEQVYDLTSLKPFDAANKTVIMFLKKGPKTVYPVPYIIWTLNKRKTKQTNYKTDVISEKCIAKPSDVSDLKSGWLTTSSESIHEKDKCLGINDYKARIGVFTGGANSVFWVRVINKNGNKLTIRNLTERAIKKVESIECVIEDTYVNPMVRGRDLDDWSFQSEQSIIFPHTAESKIYPVPIEVVKEKAPLTYQYFESFKQFLTERDSFAAWEKSMLSMNYHTLQRIGPYTFCKYKVSWRYISSKFKTCVIDDDVFGHANTLIPNEKIAYVGLDNKEEAYYLCGILSSTAYRRTIESFMVSTQIGPGILDKLYIPKYDPQNEYHRKISDLCYAGHINHQMNPYLGQIDEVVGTHILQDR